MHVCVCVCVCAYVNVDLVLRHSCCQEEVGVNLKGK